MKKQPALRAMGGALALSACCAAFAQDRALDPVTVTSSRYETSLNTTPAAITVISRDQIEASGALTVNEAIMRLAGVPARPSLNGGGEYSLDLAGFGDTSVSNQVIVIDGIPIKEGDSTEVRLSGIPIEQVERIEILRGGGSVLYGEGAVAGVIQIVTRQAAGTFAPGAGATAGVSLGTWNTQEYRASGWAASEQVRVDASAVSRHSDGYRENSQTDGRSGRVNLQSTLGPARLSMFAELDDVNARLPGSLTLAQFAANPRQLQSAEHAGDHFTSNQQRLGGTLETDWSGTLLRLTASSRNRDTGYNGPGYFIGSGLNADTLSLELRRAQRFDPMLNTVVAGAEQTSWRLGRDVQSSFGPSDSHLTSRSWAAYVKDDLELSATATRFSAGLRTERIERSVNALEIADRMTGWETGVSQSLDTAGSLYGRVAGSYRLPNADELACTLANGCAGIPTVNVLSPQTSVDKEIGWRQRWGQLARMSVRLVRSDLHNEIAYDATQFANVNLDPTRREALELEGLWRVAPELELGGLVGVRRTQFVSGPWAGNRIPMAPQGVASLTARWSIDSRQSLSTTVSAVASQYIAGDFANQASIPAYWTADVHYRLNYAGVQWGLTIRNLFDRSYYSYATTGYDANYNPYTAVYPDPGRSLLASARVVF